VDFLLQVSEIDGFLKTNSFFFMKLVSTVFTIFLLQVIPVRAQNVENVLDFIPGGGSETLAESGITGFIDYHYSGEISKARREANHFTVVFIDSSGRIIKSVEFNRFRKIENYWCNAFNESGNLAQRIHYGPGGELLWSEGFFYDVSGKLVEQVEYAEDGSIDGKMLFFFNEDGHLYKTRQLNYAGELSFWQIFYYSDEKLPERISLKQAQGFTMSNTLILYDDDFLPIQRKVSAGRKAPVSSDLFFYDANHLLAEQRFFYNRDLEAINIRNYCRGNFDRMLMENKLYMDEGICPTQCCDPVISEFVSHASFPGGTAALEAYLNSTVKMPVPAPQQGVVMVEFEVKTNGKVRKVKVQKGLTPLLDEMAVDIVQDMPNWIPAQSTEGKPKKSMVYLPVVFLK
jgi:TonB family protein